MPAILIFAGMARSYISVVIQFSCRSLPTRLQTNRFIPILRFNLRGST